MLTLILMLMIAQTPTDDAVTALRAYNIPRHSELWIELSPVLNNPEKVAGLQRKYQVDDEELALIKKVAVKDRWQLGAGLSWNGDQIVNHVLNLRRYVNGPALVVLSDSQKVWDEAQRALTRKDTPTLVVLQRQRKVAAVPRGTPVEVEGGWGLTSLKVRLPDGRSGWIEPEYLSEEPVAKRSAKR